MAMDIDRARATVLALLQGVNQATDSELLAVLGGDQALLAQVRQNLIAGSQASATDPPGLKLLPTEAASRSTSSTSRPKVFLSYGRRDTGPLVDRLYADLSAAGFEVWRDTGTIHAGGDYQAAIVAGLKQADVVVAVMSPHSVRTAGGSGNEQHGDSFCLAEISYALSLNPPKPLVPVMAETCQPPLEICRLDFVDLRRWCEAENEYRVGLGRVIRGILAALAGERPAARLSGIPEPLDFSSFIESRRRNFQGRQRLFERIDAWRRDSARERVLLLKGDPGVGKSAILAELADRNHGASVLAFHACQWDFGETLRPARFVSSLAAQIAVRLEDYAVQLNHNPALVEALGEARCESDPASGLEIGIFAPLEKIAPPTDGPLLLVIDALEASLLRPPGTPTLVDLLAMRLHRLPGWLRIVASTRNDPAVVSRLELLRGEELDATADDNLADLRQYLDVRLATAEISSRLTAAQIEPESIREMLLRKSEGNFLYVCQTLDALEAEQLDPRALGDLPPGLVGLYENRFRQEFSQPEAFAAPKRVFEVLVAAQQPLARDELAQATELDADDELPAVLARLAVYVPARPDKNGESRYAFFHRSLYEWLTDPRRSGLPYSVSSKRGHRRLADAGWKSYGHGASRLSPYALAHLPLHLVQAQLWDKLATLLTDLAYWEAKNSRGLVFQLASDLALAWQSLDPEEPARHTLKLLEEALRRNINYIDRHRADYPQALFQAVWNQAWWYDCPEAARYYEGDYQPVTVHGQSLHGLLERWRKAKETRQPGFAWLRTLLPPRIHLNSPRQAILWGHEREVVCVALAPNGHRVVSGSSDKTVRVWDAVSGAVRLVLCGHERRVSGVASSHDGRLLASASWDGSVRVWNGETGECVRVIPVAGGVVTCVAMSPDARWLVAGTEAGAIHVWDATSGTPRSRLSGHGLAITGVAVSSDPAYVACAATDRSVRLWDLANGQSLAKFHWQDEADTSRYDSTNVQSLAHVPISVAISSNGRRIATGSPDSIVRVWDLDNANLRLACRGHGSAVTCVAISSDGSHLASGSVDRTVRVWSAESGASLAVLHGHEYGVTAVNISVDGRRVVSAAVDRTVQLWDIRGGVAPHFPRRRATANHNLAFSADGQWVVSATRARTVRVWDARGTQELMTLDALGSRMTGIALSADGGWVVGGTENSEILIWNPPHRIPQAVLRGHQASVGCVSLSSDGSRVVSGSADHTARLWDRARERELQIFQGHSQAVIGVAYAEMARRFVTGSLDRTVRIWDAETGKCLVVLEAGAAVRSVAISADGQRVAATIGDDTTRMWDGRTHALLETVEGLVDAAALVAGAKAFAWRGINRVNEFVVAPVGGGAPLAFFSNELKSLTTHPGGRRWAGSRGGFLQLIELEGNSPPGRGSGS